jgi:hypothetical protein
MMDGEEHVLDSERLQGFYHHIAEASSDALVFKQNYEARWRARDAAVFESIRGGAHVPLHHLADLLRYSVTLPRDIRDHIAGRLDGTIKKRGRPTPEHDDEYLYRRAQLAVAALWVRQRHRENKASGMKAGKPGSEDPYRAALRDVAAEWGVEEETLDKHVYPRKHRRR